MTVAQAVEELGILASIDVSITIQVSNSEDALNSVLAASQVNFLSNQGAHVAVVRLIYSIKVALVQLFKTEQVASVPVTSKDNEGKKAPGIKSMDGVVVQIVRERRTSDCFEEELCVGLAILSGCLRIFPGILSPDFEPANRLINSLANRISSIISHGEDSRAHGHVLDGVGPGNGSSQESFCSARFSFLKCFPDLRSTKESHDDKSHSLDVVEGNVTKFVETQLVHNDGSLSVLMGKDL